MTTYDISWQSGGTQGISGKENINLPRKAKDSTSTSLVLTGKGVINYGEIQQENFIHLLENFASDSAPANPTVGQIWYHRGVGPKIYSSSGTWSAISSSGNSGETGPTGPVGPTGPANTSPGPTGPQGATGPQGPDGVDNGGGLVVGATGPQGPTGPAGADGSDGAQGPASSEVVNTTPYYTGNGSSGSPIDLNLSTLISAIFSQAQCSDIAAAYNRCVIAITPQQAINFFYDNTTDLIAYDTNYVQSFVPRGRYNFSNNFNSPPPNDVINDQSFDFSTQSLTGVASESVYSTVLGFGFGSDDYSDSPVGHQKTFSDFQLTLAAGGAVAPSQYEQNGAVVAGFGFGFGAYHVRNSVKEIDAVRLDLRNGLPGGDIGNDDYSNYHTMLIPGRWIYNKRSTDYNVIAGNPSTPQAFPDYYPTTSPFIPGPVSVIEYIEYPVTIPAWGFMLMANASDTSSYDLPPTSFIHEYSVKPTGVLSAYERRSTESFNIHSSSMMVNTTGTPQTVLVRYPWTTSALYSDGVSGPTTVYSPGMRWQSIHVWQPDVNFDSGTAANGQVVGANAVVSPLALSGKSYLAYNMTPIPDFGTVGANAQMNINSDGSYFVSVGEADSINLTENVGAGMWFNPATAGIGNTYFVRFLKASESSVGVSGNTSTEPTGWLPLDQTRNVTVAKNVGDAGGTGIQSNQVTYEVQIANSNLDSGILSVAQFTLIAQVGTAASGGGGGEVPIGGA